MSTRDEAIAAVVARLGGEAIIDPSPASIVAEARDLGDVYLRTEWEYAWIPVLPDGEEWEPRSEEDCDALIAAHSDPKHWINEGRNDDLCPVVSKRRVRRLPATEWEPV